MSRRFGAGIATTLVGLAAAAIVLRPIPARAGRLPRYGGDLRVQLASVPATLDPLRLAGDDGAIAASCVFEGLTRWKGTDLVPALARSWVRDDAGERWLFQLRDDAVFHDGTRCDAEAVRQSLQRLADPRVSPQAWLLSGLVGWDDFAAGRTQRLEGLDVAPPDQVELRFTSPVLDLPARLALPAAAIARKSADSWEGTGPFQVLARRAGELRLAASRDHYEGRPFLDHLELVARSDAEKGVTAEAIAMTRVLVADPLPAGSVRWRTPADRLAFALARPQSEVFAAEVLRRRLAEAFDRTVFVRAVLGGDGEATEGISPQGPKTISARSGSAAEPPTADLARRPEQRARIIVPAGEPVLRALGERLQVHLFALGVGTDLDVLATEAFGAALTAGAYDMVVLAWTPPQPGVAALESTTRAQYFAAAALLPVLGSALPEAWSPLRLGAAKDPEHVLLRSAACIPLVFFHDLWQTTADLVHFEPGGAAAALGVASAHLEPRAP